MRHDFHSRHGILDRGVAGDAARREHIGVGQLAQLRRGQRHDAGGALRNEKLRVPRRHRALVVERRLQVDQRRRALRVPAVLVVAAPLHPHRRADLAGEQRGVAGGILVAVAAIAARALDVDAAHVLRLHLRHDAELLGEVVRRLAGGPAGQLAVVPFGDGAGRADRAVGMNGEVVGGFQRLCRARHRRLGVAFGLRDVFVEHLGVAHVVPKFGLLGQAGPRGPLHLELARRLDRCPLALADDAEEVGDAHHLHQAGNVLDRAFVDALQRGAECRRAYHATVQHARHLEVLHVGEGAGALARDVEPRHRLADDGVEVWVLGRRLGIELQVEVLAADQLAVADRLADHAAAGLRLDRAVLGDELVGRHADVLGAGGEERLPRRGAGLADLQAALLDGVRAVGRRLVRRQQGVALDHRDRCHRHVEFLGDHLGQRRLDAGAEIDLPGEQGDVALRVDGEVGVDVGGGDDLVGERVAGLARGGVAGGFRHGARDREGDGEQPGGGEQRAAIDRIHGRAPQIVPAARCSARTMRMWVPQRHRLAASASRMSPSLGLGFSFRKAAPCMIMPLMQ